MGSNGKSARHIVADNLAAIRARVGMSSAEKLEQKVKALGGKLDRAAISKIENKTRGVSLDEALLLAAALDVAPVHLFISLDDEDLIQVAPGLEPVPADVARDWVRGRQPLPATNEKNYRTAWIPDSEWEQRNARVEAAREAVRAAGRQVRVKQAMLDKISEDVYAANPGSHLSMVPGTSTGGMLRVLIGKLDAAYEAVAVSTVDLEDARAELRRVLAEDEERK